MGVGGAGGGLDVGAGSVGAGDEEVVVDRVVEENGILGDDGDVAAEIGEAEGAEVVAVEGDAAGDGIEEAGDEIGEGGFAGAAGADEGADGARGDEDGDVVEDEFAGLVGEADVFETEGAVGAGEGAGVGGVDDGDGGLEDGFEAFEGAEAALQLVVEAAEFFDGLVAGVEGGDEDDERFLVEVDLVGVKQGERDADGGDDFDEGREGLLILHELHLRADERLRGALEARDLACFEAEGADFLRRAEVFAEDIRYAAELGLNLAGALDEFLADVADGENGEWHDGENHEDEGDALHVIGLPRDIRNAANEAGGATHDLIGDGDERELELVGVREAAGEQVARGVFLEKRERENLEFAEEIEADGFEDARAGELDEVGVEVGGAAAEQEDERDPQDDDGKLPIREGERLDRGEGIGLIAKNNGEDPIDHQG